MTEDCLVAFIIVMLLTSACEGGVSPDDAPETTAPPIAEATDRPAPDSLLLTPTSEAMLAAAPVSFADSGQRLGSAQSWGLALGDLDGDGDLDVFMAVASGHANQVWLNDGSGAFSDGGQRLQSPLAHSVSLGDLDGDGDLDAFTAHGDRQRGSGGRMWLNDGDGRFNDCGMRLGDLHSSGVALGDLDGDGGLDAFISHGELWQESGGGLPNAGWLNRTP